MEWSRAITAQFQGMRNCNNKRQECRKRTLQFVQTKSLEISIWKPKNSKSDVKYNNILPESGWINQTGEVVCMREWSSFHSCMHSDVDHVTGFSVLLKFWSELNVCLDPSGIAKDICIVVSSSSCLAQNSKSCANQEAINPIIQLNRVETTEWK